MPITTSAASGVDGGGSSRACHPGAILSRACTLPARRGEENRRPDGARADDTATTTLVVIAATAALLAACGSGRSDKAGGLTQPVVLRIANHDQQG